MKTYKNLWKTIYGFDNLQSAYEKAKRHKSTRHAVIEFEQHWRLHLCTLLRELRTKTYRPMALKKFVLRDPKTRLICVSDFRDRIIHHTLINVLQPIFEPRFIFDSYASRKGKGTLPAIQRFDYFKRKVSKNNTKDCYVFKADIKHYFQTVDHQMLLNIIARRVKDQNTLWLIKNILEHYDSGNPGRGMPLGNWTSQFFANIYLNELDQFVKHKIGAKHYIRYVDDFVILHHSKKKLQEYKKEIKDFLGKLKLELHPNKCKIIPLSRGVSFLGFRVFYYHKLVRKRNLRTIKSKLESYLDTYTQGNLSAWDILETLQGWNAYAMHGNTYNLRQGLQQQICNRLKQD